MLGLQVVAMPIRTAVPWPPRAVLTAVPAVGNGDFAVGAVRARAAYYPVKRLVAEVSSRDETSKLRPVRTAVVVVVGARQERLEVSGQHATPCRG